MTPLFFSKLLYKLHTWNQNRTMITDTIIVSLWGMRKMLYVLLALLLLQGVYTCRTEERKTEAPTWSGEFNRKARATKLHREAVEKELKETH